MRGAAGVRQTQDMAEAKSHNEAKRKERREAIARLIRAGEPSPLIQRKLSTTRELVAKVAREEGLKVAKADPWGTT